MLIGNSFEFEGSINQFGWELLELMLETKEGITYSEPEINSISLSSAEMEPFTGKYIINFDTVTGNIFWQNDIFKPCPEASLNPILLS